MSTTTFTYLPALPTELRIMIWEPAIATHVEDFANSIPGSVYDVWAEGRRHAQIPYEWSRLPLKLRVRDPYDGRKMRLEENEFESLVNSFPISAVSREVRNQVAEFCRTLVPDIEFEYTTVSNLFSLEPPAPEDGEDPVVLRNVHCLPGAETLEHVFAKPTSLTVCGGRDQFKSPEHFVSMINRFFGDRVERLSLESWAGHHLPDPQKRPYWASSVEAAVDIEPTFIIDAKHDPSMIFLTPDRKLHVVRQTWEDRRYAITRIARHLLEFYDILDASVTTLPRLKHIDLKLDVQVWDSEWTYIKSSCKDGVLSVNIKEVAIF
ncbi:hypothetical protein BDV95DRAFT_584482 [Massariosphaeria phaeospora]|uniref:Uncharacterized protein n=1 Tax=Massariosphaeria phaeospora TaxID=100035 RepID=A0A7C8M5H5_9PLEO|nr:hypothetical protein BDV95DRAFT_584482 [Massariosphaeria phaeospora]